MAATKADISSSTKSSTTKVGPIPEIPVLQYVSGSANNIHDFLKKLLTYSLRVWVELGLVVELDEYWEPPEIEFPDAFLLSKAADPHGFLKEDVKEQIKARRHFIERMKSSRVQLFATIWSQLSVESEKKIKQYSTWEDVDEQ